VFAPTGRVPIIATFYIFFGDIFSPMLILDLKIVRNIGYHNNHILKRCRHKNRP